jgi:hypothetical protein
MSDEPKKRKWKWIAWGAITLFVLYPLSVGPVSRLCASSDSQWAIRVFRIVYAPIDLACFLIPAAGDAYFWYVNLWLPPAP